jgi:hypothetical protein
MTVLDLKKIIANVPDTHEVFVRRLRSKAGTYDVTVEADNMDLIIEIEM